MLAINHNLSFLIIILFSGLQLFSAQKMVELVNADFVQARPDLFEGNPFCTGNVRFKHQGSILDADTVVLFEKENSLWAKSRVKMNIGDTVFLACRNLEYNGNSRQAVAKGNVILKDPSQKLETDELFYDRSANKAYFNTRSKITQGQNIMYSNYGVYNLNNKTTQFQRNVDIDTPEYKINSTDLLYSNYSGIADVKGPTTIVSKENPKNYIYMENGTYDTKKKEAFLRKNSEVHSNGKVLTGDEMYFNQNTEFGYAKGNFKLNDPEEKRFLKGDYGEYYQKLDSAMATGKPYVVKALDKDSLYISADTLSTKRDSAKLSTIYGYHKVRVYKSDIQAKCDSLNFKESLGIMTFYQDPVFWNSYRQITGDTIRAFSNVKEERLDSIHVLSNAFAVSKTDSLTTSDFNQVKGRFMLGIINNEELRYVKVEGNAESIVFVDDEDEKTKERKRIGINKSLCGIIEADFYEREVHIIECNINGEGKLYPVNKFPSKLRYLNGFVWRDKERPRKWQDIFVDIPEEASSEFTPIPEAVLDNSDTPIEDEKRNLDLEKNTQPENSEEIEIPLSTPVQILEE